MKLSDLLAELRENILHDRSDRVEGSNDYLWTDATLVRYINEAQRRFARKSLILRDGSTPEVTQVTLVAGQKDYALNSAVLAVMSARLPDENNDLARTGHSAFNTYQTPDTYYFDTSTLAAQSPGKPIVYRTDEQLGLDDNDSTSTVQLTLYPAPSTEYAGKILQLRVVRLPVEPLTAGRLNVYPEIPEDHHIEMLDWAAYLALRIVDHDAGDPARANEFRASFEDHVKQARRDAMRKMFTPQPWGFGRNGFTWES